MKIPRRRIGNLCRTIGSAEREGRSIMRPGQIGFRLCLIILQQSSLMITLGLVSVSSSNISLVTTVDGF